MSTSMTITWGSSIVSFEKKQYPLTFDVFARVRVGSDFEFELNARANDKNPSTPAI